MLNEKQKHNDFVLAILLIWFVIFFSDWKNANC